MTITNPTLSNLKVRLRLDAKDVQQIDRDNEGAEQVIMDDRGAKNTSIDVEDANKIAWAG